MNCRSAEHTMDRALDEAMPGARMEELQAHMARCPGCRRQWEALQMAEAVLRVPQPAPAPDDLLADFRRRLEAERPVAARTPERPWLSWLWPAGSVAAAGLAAALAVTFNLPGAFDMPETPSTVSSGGNRGYVAPFGSAGRPESVRPNPKQKPEPRTSDFALAPGNRGRSAPKLSDEMSLTEKLPAVESQMSASRDPLRRGKARESEVALGIRDLDPSSPAALPKQFSVASKLPVDRGLARKQTGQGLAASGFSETLRQIREREKGLPAPTPPQQPLAEFHRGRQEGVAAGTTPLHTGVAGARPEPDSYIKKKSDLADRTVSDAERLVRAKESQSNFGTHFGGFGGGALGGNTRAATVASDPDQVRFFFDATETIEPRELDVSPAVLTALQRPVEVQLQRETLAGAVRQLAEAADVVLSYDPRAGGMAVNVSTPEPQVPLWVVLQEVAQQNNLQIVPRENRLELRSLPPVVGKPAADAPVQPLPLGSAIVPVPAPVVPRGAVPTPAPTPAATGAGSALGVQRYQMEQRSMFRAVKPRADERPSAPVRRLAPELKPAKPVEKREPKAPKELMEKAFKAGQEDPAPVRFGYQFEREQVAGNGTAPDRRVWPDLWGRLPEWGFALPTLETLPAAEAGEEAKAAESLRRRVPTRPESKAKPTPRK